MSSFRYQCNNCLEIYKFRQDAIFCCPQITEILIETSPERVKKGSQAQLMLPNAEGEKDLGSNE